MTAAQYQSTWRYIGILSIAAIVAFLTGSTGQTAAVWILGSILTVAVLTQLMYYMQNQTFYVKGIQT